MSNNKYNIITDRTASGIPEAERYQRHGNEYRIALVFHGEQGPLCIYPGRDDHLQGA